jgi:hypothetical protein
MKPTHITTALCAAFLGSAIHIASAGVASPEPLRALVAGWVEAEYPSLGVPICMWWVGATDPAKFIESERTGVPVPSNHSATFVPDPEPTLKTCVTSMTAAVLELIGNESAAKEIAESRRP